MREPLAFRRVIRTAPRLLASAALFAVCFAPNAAASFTAKFRPQLRVEKVQGRIRIDGRLDDSGWRLAARADGFAEVSPGDQSEPPVQSEAWVTYDESNLYVALIARDDPAEVRASMSDRDAIFRDDYFGIMIDPYGDQSSGYELFVNPLGIQGDLRMLSSGGEDMSFDAIWESKGQVTEDGYQVELAIPFASLRLPDKAQQTWRVNFWRDHQRDVRRQYAWAAQDRDNPCFMCQWGEMTGIEGISGSRPLEIIATGLASQAGSGDPDTDFDMEDPHGEASATVKYALSSSAFAEVTVNPDFSQVESDAGQIDVNQTFALFYDERRPFFQEGSDLLGTWIDAIYTRSINDPNVAGKFTGQFDKTSVVYALAQDENSPIIVPLEERSQFVPGGQSFSNIVRVRRSLQEDTYVGGVFTDRRLSGGGSGTVGGVDGLVRKGSYQLELQGLVSRTEEPVIDDDDLEGTFGDGHTVALDGETFSGNAVYASAERWGRTYRADFDYWAYSPEFRTDNGFTTRNDYRQTSFWNGLQFRPDHEWLSRWQVESGIGRVWSTDGTFQDEWIRPTIWGDTKGQTNLGSQYLTSRERFGGTVFPGIRIWSYWIDSRFSEQVSVAFNLNQGRGIYRDFDEPELADQRFWSAELRLHPSSRLEINTGFEHGKMDSRERNENLFSGYIVRSRADVTFTRQLFLRLVVQYDDFDERLDIEPLVTYRVNPFTLFYLGMTSGRQRFSPDDYDSITKSEWGNADRQLFAKIQYQFRL
ncbi:carbohydrate binding family 9 domain-containing protein [bacterium]|nr:carbohydrate binding family 9 domain-containing protein [bacterium]